MRLKSWTINCFITLVAMAWVGVFGLRCLCGVEPFECDQSYDYVEHKVISVKRDTVLGVFFHVIDGIKKSRENFESQPDRGLFGKNLSRICNLI